MSFILFTGPDCLSRTAREHNDWVTLRKPKCWCYRKQWRGDAYGLLLGPLPVSLNDPNVLRGCLNLPFVPPVVNVPTSTIGPWDRCVST